MAIDKKLLEILVCPATRTPVKQLPANRLEILNEAVKRGEIKHLDGTQVEAPLDEALITDDGRRIYPVRDGIPVMLEDRGIIADQIPGW